MPRHYSSGPESQLHVQRRRYPLSTHARVLMIAVDRKLEELEESRKGTRWLFGGVGHPVDWLGVLTELWAGRNSKATSVRAASLQSNHPDLFLLPLQFSRPLWHCSWKEGSGAQKGLKTRGQNSFKALVCGSDCAMLCSWILRWACFLACFLMRLFEFQDLNHLSKL